MLQECVRILKLAKYTKILLLLVSLILQFSKIEGANFEIDLNRKIINHFTNVLSNNQENLEGVLFDLGENSFIVTIIFEAKNSTLFSWIKPTLRPGEIFLPANQRTGLVSKSDEKDFVVAVRIEFDLTTKSSDLDAVYLRFQQPKAGAYYRQDFSEFKRKQSELGILLGKYDSARSDLSEINHKLKSSNLNNVGSQLTLTSKKIEVRKKLNLLGGQLDALNRQIVRFSGTYLSVLPSDKLLQETIKSLAGDVSGDSILAKVYRRFNEMNVVSNQLDIQLLGQIQQRSGIVRVGNIGESLIGIIPGLQINKLEIVNKSTDAHHSSGLLTQNYILSLKADVVEVGRGK